MPWCPNCRYEYREGFTTCSDCGAALVEELPEKEPEPREEAVVAEEESLVAVYDSRDEIEAANIKDVLKEAGISVAEKHLHVDGSMMAPLGNLQFPFSRLFTHESRARRRGW